MRGSNLRVSFVVAAGMAASWAVAAEVQLKNGMTFSGPRKPVELKTFGAPIQPLANAAPEGRPIVMLENTWQRYYFPRRQIRNIEPEFNFNRLEVFDIKRTPVGHAGAIGAVGLPADITPWDEFAKRRLTFLNGKKPLHVVQAISQLTPQATFVTALTHDWRYGMATASVPPDVIETALRLAIDPTDSQQRFKVVRFCVQAELYPLAEKELRHIAEAFPERSAQANTLLKEIKDLRGRQLMAELQRRRTAGQHGLAEQIARRLLELELPAETRRAAEGFVAEFDRAREQLARVELLLGELQAQVHDFPEPERLLELRSEVLAQLAIPTLSRFEPLLRVEQDRSLSATEKLGLAYSGWLLGPAHAMADLETAVSLWSARALVEQFLTEADPALRLELHAALRGIESVNPRRLAILIQQMRPVVTTEEAVPGVPLWLPLAMTSDSVPPQANEPAAEKPAGYWVVLPPEYSPDIAYPVIVALHPPERTAEQAAEWWSGTNDSPGLGQRRGYIVLAPAYNGGRERRFDSEQALAVVKQTLRDARRRFRCDDERILLVGHGVGGDAAWEVGLRMPSQFAGVALFGADAGDLVRQLWPRSYGLSWYFVAGELDRDWLGKSANRATLESLFMHGAQCDALIVQFLGRGYEPFGEELPRLFDWMENLRRKPWPIEFETSTTHPSADDFAWLSFPEAQDRKSQIKGRVSPGNPVSITVTAPEGRTIVRLNESLLDFEKRVKVSIRGRQQYDGFLKTDSAALLDDYRDHYDRGRLCPVVLEFR